MWSQFCKRYKQGLMEPSVDGEDKTALIVATLALNMLSYISRQSAVAANTFLSTLHKKGRFKQATKWGGPLFNLLSPTPSFSKAD